jgi:hypothetical protein
MLKLFRSIRKGLLSENKFSRYLVYAFGEIILVVIGILIALAINNGNQNRLLAKTEQTYLLGLKEEFHTSKLKLTELITVNQNNLEAAKKILNHSSDPSQSLSETEFSELMYTAFSSDIAFNPNNSFLIEMINSGNLKNISNPKLRILLTNWTSTMEDITRQERDLGIQRERVLDLFRTGNNSLKTVLIQAGVYRDLGLMEEKTLPSNLALLSSTEFENNLLMFILASIATENAHYAPLLRDLEDIQILIEKEIR